MVMMKLFCCGGFSLPLLHIHVARTEGPRRQTLNAGEARVGWYSESISWNRIDAAWKPASTSANTVSRGHITKR